MGTNRADQQRFEWQFQIIHRAGRGCKVIDHINRAWNGIGLNDIDIEVFEFGVAAQVSDIIPTSSDKVVHCDHIVSLSQKPVAEVGSEKSGSTGNYCTRHC